MFNLFLKGLIIGIAKIVPGVSGAVLAISFGIYEKSIEAISNFFKNPIKNFKFLFPIGLGILISIALMSKLVLYFLTMFYLPTMLLFIGLIISSITFLLKKINYQNFKIKKIIIFILSFVFVFCLPLFNNNYFLTGGFLSFMFIGLIDSFTMIIPGISGTAVMMLLGCYNLLLMALSLLTSLSGIINNLNIFIGFTFGIVIGVIAFSKLMNYLFKKKEQYTYCSILGFSLASILLLFIKTFENKYSPIEIIIGLFFLIFGIFISKRFNT